MACGTLRRGHEIQQILAVVFRGGIVQDLLEVGHDSAKAALTAAFRLAVEQQSLNFVRQLLEGRAEVKSVGGSGDLQHVYQILRGGSGTEATFEQGFGPVHDDLCGVEIIAAAEAMTLGAGAVGTVEGERAGLQLRHADATIGTGETRRVKRLLAANDGDLHQATGEFHRQSDREFEAMLDPRLYQKTVDDNFDGVVFSLVQSNVIFKIHDLAINPGAGEAVLDQLLHFFFEFAFAAANDGGHNHDPVLGS